MRIDREAFLLAVAALAGCERAAPSPSSNPPPAPPPVVARVEAPKPAASAIMPARELPPAPTPIPAPVPVQRPVTARHRQSPAKRWFLGLTMDQRNNVTTSCAMRASTSCRAALRMGLAPPSPETEGETAAAPVVDPDIDPTSNLPTAKVVAYCQEDFHPPSCETPLVVAFENQPVEFAPSGHDRFAFVPGDPAATDWPTEATPWIALDLDGDGAITSGAELFGSSTVLASGAHALNGFAALAALDANGDGILDARDPMFGRLVLWSDRNRDHRSTPDELRPLSSTVTAIPLGFTRDARCNERDDCEGERGTLRWRDAGGAEHAGTVVDVYIPR